MDLSDVVVVGLFDSKVQLPLVAVISSAHSAPDLVETGLQE